MASCLLVCLPAISSNMFVCLDFMLSLINLCVRKDFKCVLRIRMAEVVKCSANHEHSSPKSPKLPFCLYLNITVSS